MISFTEQTCRVELPNASLTIEIRALEFVMAAIARILSRVSGTDIEVETLETVVIFCRAGLLVALGKLRLGFEPRFFLGQATQQSSSECTKA